ncbi:spermine/spermidine synthase domain-containing protein [Streptomyces lycii]|uniref:Polyamine aminopropyltransferase n=1 Tax=Streptomyces lycii TaxID=2654337 RepID=A0ABQ7FPX4_9ACTN|nr:spermidine synthase [Streptomyces lycii]KAF4409806.1 spermidine synthase [Streptomyces lycii]
MIELPESRLLSGAAAGRPAVPEGAQAPVRLPVPAGPGRLLVLGVVFVCAACGLVYELELVALASYLFGDSVTQASVVLSVMVFAMGVGSLLAKRLRGHAAAAFGLVEAALALIGGGSAMALHASFVWSGHSRVALVVFSFVIGALIGAEVPLLMTLIQRIRRQDAGGAVADLFAADYVGALVGGLAFPFLLLPLLGQLSGALATGAVNTVAGGAMVLWLFGRDLTARIRWTIVVANGLVLALLGVGAAFVGSFEEAARRAVYGADVRVVMRTEVQEVVVTGGVGADSGNGARGAAGAGTGGALGSGDGGSGDGGSGEGRSGDGAHGDGGSGTAGPAEPLALFLDGRLRVSGRVERRYQEALVHPAMNGPRERVLVLGGADGLAAREVLRYGDVRSVTVVDTDPAVFRLARTDPGLSRLNRQSMSDPRVHAVAADVFGWLRGADSAYDVVVADLPDPRITDSTKLYAQEFYGLVERALAPGGRFVVRVRSAAGQPRTYWTVDATLRSAGFRTVPYRIDDRGSGGAPGAGRAAALPTTPRDRGFLLAGRRAVPLRLPSDAPPLLSLDPGSLRAAARAAEGGRVDGLPPSTLTHARY